MAEEAQYLAGFLDGDGHIGIQTPTTKYRRPLPTVSASQSCSRSEPRELKFLKSNFAGGIHVIREATTTTRRMWNFKAHGVSVEDILLLISKHGIVKKPQADLALEYLAKDRANPKYYSEILSFAKSCVKSVDIDPSRLTTPYLAGLFAAEGTVGLHRNKDRPYLLESGIAQASCPRLLHAIRERLGYGSVTHGQIRFSVKATGNFLDSIQPFIRKSQKNRQVKVVQKYLKYVATLRKGGIERSREEKDQIEKYAKRLRNLKKR